MIEVLINNTLAPIRQLFKSGSDALENAILDTAEPSIPTSIIMVFLFILGCFGVKHMTVSISIVFMLATPLCCRNIHFLFETWKSEAANGSSTQKICEFFVNLFESINKNILLTMIAVLLLCIITGAILNSASTFVYAFGLLLYYRFILYPHAGVAYFDPKSFLTIIASIPLVIVFFYYSAFRKFILSLLFAFTSCIGLLRIFIRDSEYKDQRLDEMIIDDFFHFNVFDKMDATVLFSMFIASKIFIQYSLSHIFKEVSFSDKEKGRTSGFETKKTK